MSGKYDESTGNGDWREWKRLLVEQVRELREEQKVLRRENAKQWTELAVLKTKIAWYSAIISVLGSAAVSWVMKNMGGP